MMAAAQPFLSGAISKTVNLPERATAADCVQVFSLSWKLGLKAIALYRDGSKLSQPLRANREIEEEEQDGASPAAAEPVVPLPEQVRVAALSTVGAAVSATASHGSGSHDQAVREATGSHQPKAGLQDSPVSKGIASDLRDGDPGGQTRPLANDIAIALAVGLQHGIPLSRFLDALQLGASAMKPAEHSSEPSVLLDQVVHKLHLENVVDSSSQRQETPA